MLRIILLLVHVPFFLSHSVGSRRELMLSADVRGGKSKNSLYNCLYRYLTSVQLYGSMSLDRTNTHQQEMQP